MITPISELSRSTKYLNVVQRIRGNTLGYRQNSVGDWTIITTIKWPILFIPVIIFFYLAPFAYAIFFIHQEKGFCNILSMYHIISVH